MNRKIANITKVLLCVTMMISCISGCILFFEPENDAQFVEESANYFSSSKLSIGDEERVLDLYDEVFVNALYYDNSYFIVKEDCSLHGFEGDKDTKSFIKKFDYTGNQLGIIEIENPSDFIIDTVYDYDENVYVVSYDSKHSKNITFSELDFYNNKIIEKSSISFDKVTNYLAVQRVFEYNENLVVAYEYEDKGYLKTSICFLDNIQNICREYDFDCWVGVSYLDDLYLLCCSDKNKAYKFNLQKCSAEQIDLSEKYLRREKVDGGLCCDRLDNRLDVYDIKSDSEYTLVDFNYCDTDIYSFYDCHIKYISDEIIVMRDGAVNIENNEDNLNLIILNNVESNPYIGRRIIEVAQIQGCNKSMSCGILYYNQSQENYYAYVSSRYGSDFIIPDVYNGGLTRYERIKLVVDQIMVDVNNGDGPDIIVGIGYTTEIDRNRYLVDVSRIIQDDQGFDVSAYFEKALFSHKNAEGLYQIPLEISGLGLAIDNDSSENYGIGFNYNEYHENVVIRNNGIDPWAINADRNWYLENLYSNCEELFYVDGVFDANSPAFIDMVRYIKENTIESSMSLYDANSEYVKVGIYNFEYDIQNAPIMYDRYDLFGGPSADGRGLMMITENTVAITNNAFDIDVCWDVIKSMLSYPVQVQTVNNAINKKAFSDHALKVMQKLNDENSNEENYIEITQSDIDRYIDILERFDHDNAIDVEVYLIVKEEIQAYFENSKTLEQVVDVINNRVNLVINERGT